MSCIVPLPPLLNNWDNGILFNLISFWYGTIELYFHVVLSCLICGLSWSFSLTSRIIVAVILREKEKLKEREEAWLKIDELARKNPNVSTLDSQITKDKINNQLWDLGSMLLLFSCSELHTKPSNSNVPSYAECGVPH